MRWERRHHTARLSNPTLAYDFPARWAEQEDLIASRVSHLVVPVFDNILHKFQLFGFNAERLNASLYSPNR